MNMNMLNPTADAQPVELQGQVSDNAQQDPSVDATVADQAAQQTQPVEEAPSIFDKVTSAFSAGGIGSQAVQMLDRDGDGNPLNDIVGMASGLFGRK